MFKYYSECLGQTSLDNILIPSKIIGYEYLDKSSGEIHIFSRYNSFYDNNMEYLGETVVNSEEIKKAEALRMAEFNKAELYFKESMKNFTFFAMVECNLDESGMNAIFDKIYNDTFSNISWDQYDSNVRGFIEKLDLVKFVRGF